MANRRSRSQNRYINPSDGKGVELYKPLPPKNSKEGIEAEKQKKTVRTFSCDRAINPGAHNDLVKANDAGNTYRRVSEINGISNSGRPYLLDENGELHRRFNTMQPSPNGFHSSQALPIKIFGSSQLSRVDTPEMQPNVSKSFVLNSMNPSTPNKTKQPLKRATTPLFGPVTKKSRVTTANKQPVKRSTTPLKQPSAITPNKRLGSSITLERNSNNLENAYKELKGHWKVVEERVNLIALLMKDIEDNKSDIQMVDKSTCVLTKACQLEDALLSLKPGSTACLNITIVCKAGANTLYILAKWKGKEYHGVLTDGEPVHSHLYAQKRADKNSDHTTPNSAAGGGHSDKTGVSSTGKVRGKRGANRQVAGATDKKNRHADDATENNYASGDPNSSLNCKSQEEGGSLPSTAKSSTSKQYELASDKSFVRRCPHKQCGYRFESMSEVNTHLVMGHADTRATMCEAIATQTDPIETTCMGVQTCEPEPQERLCSKCKQSTSTDQDDSSKMCPSSNTAVQKITEEKSLQDLFKVVRSNCEKKLGGESGTKSSTSPDAFSDISDDGAPMLEKEENFESNKTGADKKTAVNEPIEIIPPTENTGPTLDILSPVLSSSVATSKQDGANQKQQDLPTTTSAAASSSIPLASPLTGKRPPGSSVAQPICNLSPSPSNKPSLVQPENVQQPLNSHQPTPQQSSSSHPTGMSLPLAPPNPAPPHIFMNQMPMNPFQAASFLNPAAFYSHPQLAQFAAAAAASGQMPGSSSQANSRLVSPHQLPPSPFAVNGGGMAGPLGVPSSSGASGCLSTGKPDANSQLQRQHKIYELKQLQQQQTQPSTSTLGLPCTSSGEGGRTSATGLLGAGESPATLRSSSAVPMAAGSPSVIAARPPPFGGHRGMPGVPSPGTSMTGGASLPTQMQLQLAGLHAQQPSVSQQQQPGLSPAQMHHYQMQMQRLSQNFQAFSRNQNEMPNMIGGGLPAGGMDTATYAALFGGGNNSQLFQQQQSTAGNSSGAPGINQQNLLQPPK
uniref:C2H2-type domain-containing protein n=1 Tax=Ditylenchus dipsaci TaxID=166011 RepID=A0A915DRR0_9BILA